MYVLQKPDLVEPLEYNPPEVPEKPVLKPTKLDVIKPELISYDTELPDIIERDEVEGVDYKLKRRPYIERGNGLFRISKGHVGWASEPKKKLKYTGPRLKTYLKKIPIEQEEELQYPEGYVPMFAPGGVNDLGDKLKRFGRKFDNTGLTLNWGKLNPQTFTYVPTVGLNTLSGSNRKGWWDSDIKIGGDKDGLSTSIGTKYFGPFWPGQRTFQGSVDGSAFYDQGHLGTQLSAGVNIPLGYGRSNRGKELRGGRFQFDLQPFRARIGARKDYNAPAYSWWTQLSPNEEPTLMTSTKGFDIDWGYGAKLDGKYRLKKLPIELFGSAEYSADMVRNAQLSAEQYEPDNVVAVQVDNPNDNPYVGGDEVITLDLINYGGGKDREFKPDHKFNFNIGAKLLLDDINFKRSKAEKKIKELEENDPFYNPGIRVSNPDEVEEEYEEKEEIKQEDGGFILDLDEEEAKRFAAGGYVLEELVDGGEDDDVSYGPKSKEERKKLYNYSSDQDAPNMILTYKDDKEFIDGIANWQTVSGVPINEKFSDQIKARLYTGNYGYNPATGTLYNLNKLSAGKSKTSTVKDPYVLDVKKDLDATAGKSNEEVVQYYQDKEDALADKYDEEWKSNRHPVAIDSSDAWNPSFELKDKYGRTYNTQNFAGQSVMMTDAEEAAYRKAMLQHNAPIAQQQMNTLFSIPASFTPAGMVIMGMQGAAHMAQDVPELIENPSWSNAGKVFMDAAMVAPFVPGAVGKARPYVNQGITKLDDATRVTPGAQSFGSGTGSLVSDVRSGINEIKNVVKGSGKTNNTVKAQIKKLKEDGLIPANANEQMLIDNPNLLNTVVKRGIKDKLTVNRNVFSGDDLASTAFPEASTEALYTGSHTDIFGNMTTGQRVGLDNMTHDLDALYTFRGKGPINTHYGTHNIEARIPFNYTGTTDEMVTNFYNLQKGRVKANPTQVKNVPADVIKPGAIIDDVSGDGVTAIVGEKGSKVLDPVKVTTDVKYTELSDKYRTLNAEADAFMKSQDLNAVNKKYNTDFKTTKDAQQFLNRKAYNASKEMINYDANPPKNPELKVTNYSPFLGFEDGGFVIDLDDTEAQAYAKNGYIVEELVDNPPLLQHGGSHNKIRLNVDIDAAKKEQEKLFKSIKSSMNIPEVKKVEEEIKTEEKIVIDEKARKEALDKLKQLGYGLASGVSNYIVDSSKPYLNMFGDMISNFRNAFEEAELTKEEVKKLEEKGYVVEEVPETEVESEKELSVEEQEKIAQLQKIGRGLADADWKGLSSAVMNKLYSDAQPFASSMYNVGSNIADFYDNITREVELEDEEVKDLKNQGYVVEEVPTFEDLYDPYDPKNFYSRYYKELELDQSQDALKPEYFGYTKPLNLFGKEDPDAEYEQWKAQTFKAPRRPKSMLSKFVDEVGEYVDAAKGLPKKIYDGVSKEVDEFSKSASKVLKDIDKSFDMGDDDFLKQDLDLTVDLVQSAFNKDKERFLENKYGQEIGFKILDQYDNPDKYTIPWSELISVVGDSGSVDENINFLRRKLEKEGRISTPEEKLKPVEEKVIEVQPEPETFTERIGDVKDGYRPQYKLLAYRNQWDNNKGFVYVTAPTKQHRKNSDRYENVIGVAHFLLDASVDPQHPYNHRNNIGYIKKAKANNEWIPTFKTWSNNQVLLKYKKPEDIEEGDIVSAPLRQYKFSEINWGKTKTPRGFSPTIKEVTLNDGQGTHLLFKNRGSYSRFSGGSVVFIFEDQYGNTIVRDFAGSLNSIKKEGQSITKNYNLKPGELTLGYHDVGSFSAKPKANDNNVITADQWRDYNNNGYTGGALLIPTSQPTLDYMERMFPNTYNK
jgi:hypothetical protein